ncbi:MAG: hypothetical protein ABIR06_18850 [Cyclobacteriaceae bacterium]
MKSRKQKSPDSTQEDRKRNDALNKSDKEDNHDKLPGEYPPNEDIMNRLNTERVGIDVENFSRAIGQENFTINESIVSDPNDITDDPLALTRDIEDLTDRDAMEFPVVKDPDAEEDAEEKNESDVTEEDLQALGPKDLSMDMGEDEQLKNRVWPVDMTGKDLDIPGSELDDASEAVGSEDEENNSYSLGGDGHEDSLEGK